MKGKRIPIDQEEAIVRAYQSGLSARKAAAQFCYSPIVCFAALKRRRLSCGTRTEARQISKEYQAGIIKAYQAGASAKGAAARFGRFGVIDSARLATIKGIGPQTIALAEQVLAFEPAK